MDDLDRNLLALLRRDASQPLKALGAQVGLSASAVRDRVLRLKASGVIRRVTIQIAAPHQVAAVLFIRLGHTPDPVTVAAVTAIAGVVRCYSLGGEIDLLVEVVGVDTAALNLARDTVADLPGVASVRTSVVLNRDLDV